MPGANGSTAEVAWARVSDRRTMTAGAAIANVGPNRWTSLRASAAQNRGRGPALSGSIDVGPGSNDDGSFTFLKLGVGIAAPLANRWRVSAEDTYVNVDAVSGHVLTLGGETTRGNWSVRLQASRSLSGTLDEQSHLVRFDRSGKTHIMAGLAATQTNDRVSLGDSPAETGTTKLRQVFVGVSFPLRRHALTVAVELGEAGTTRRHGVSFFIKSPLKLEEL
jgi:hypothetical protein